MNTFKEFQGSANPSEDNLIMQVELESENGMTLMVSDTPDRMEYRPVNLGDEILIRSGL